ncbi:MAG: SCO family protein [Ilumatobacteraceae bacterium]
MKSSARVRSRLLVIGLAATVAIGAAACGDDVAPHSLVGFRPSAEQRVDTVPIPDASAGGQPFVFRAEPDGLLLVSFGYTQCPDVCPTTMASVRSGLRLMEDEAENIGLAMVTVDPVRDTPEVLTGFVQSFVPGAHALRTDDVQVLRQVSDLFGVTFNIATNDDGEVGVSHSGLLYVVDDTGVVRLSWPFGVKSADIAADLELLLDEGSAV